MKETFNLSEAFQAGYQRYLDEQYKNLNYNLDKLFKELKESQENAIRGFNAIQEYFNLFAESEGVINEEGPLGSVPEVDIKPRVDENRNDKRNKTIDNTLQSVLNLAVNDIYDRVNTSYATDNKKKEDNDMLYKAVGITTVQKISDMKFPQNIIFFIKQLISWIHRVVIFFIESFKNILRGFVGAKKKEIDPEKLKLQLVKTKKLEQIEMLPLTPGKAAAPIKAVQFNAKDLSLFQPILTEGLFDVDIFKDKKEEPISRTPVAISIDLSKDLISLKQLVQHFYDLFDNSYGSNNEALFETTDLELLLNIFKETISDVKAGRTQTYEVGENLAEVDAVNYDRIKENLYRTATNIENLKKAYVTTSSRINDIAKIINHKELLMATNMGASFRWLTATTLTEMINILNTLKPRLKRAERLEADLEKMQKAYGKVSEQLQKLQIQLNAISNVTYTTVYQRKVTNLFNSAKAMSQVITLRLTGLGMYIRELKSVEDIIETLALFNKKGK